MILQNPKEQTLVVATMNHTADLIASELYKLESMQDYVLRTNSMTREDIFNIKPNELPEYCTLYKMLYDKQIDEEFKVEKA